jgi:hypothetical protein
MRPARLFCARPSTSRTSSSGHTTRSMSGRCACRCPTRRASRPSRPRTWPPSWPTSPSRNKCPKQSRSATLAQRCGLASPALLLSSLSRPPALVSLRPARPLHFTCSRHSCTPHTHTSAPAPFTLLPLALLHTSSHLFTLPLPPPTSRQVPTSAPSPGSLPTLELSGPRWLSGATAAALATAATGAPLAWEAAGADTVEGVLHAAGLDPSEGKLLIDMMGVQVGACLKGVLGELEGMGGRLGSGGRPLAASVCVPLVEGRRVRGESASALEPGEGVGGKAP